jgi:ribosome-associated protein
MANKVVIHSDYITLGQLLKFENIVESGGFVKEFLATEVIKVNQELENRRGKKLYPKDLIEIDGYGTYEIVHES